MSTLSFALAALQAFAALPGRAYQAALSMGQAVTAPVLWIVMILALLVGVAAVRTKPVDR